MATFNRTIYPRRQDDHSFDDFFPMAYRITATVLHALIFVFGVIGNVILILVARRSRSLHTPTFAYLVSLAFADLIVLISAVPEAIIVHHLGTRWFLGQIGCSLFVFLNFLGINAGSISILGFTIEQYVAVCCGAKRAHISHSTRRQVTAVWIFSLLYCLPWLGLTEVRPDADEPDIYTCELRLSKEVHGAVFAVDLLLFYVSPLIFAVYAYSRIGWALIRSTRYKEPESPVLDTLSQVEAGLDNMACLELKMSKSHSAPNIYNLGRVPPTRALLKRREGVAQSRAQVVRMLIAIVICFAIAWLPFRGLLVYNSFVEEPWVNIWFMFMAKTLIFANSAMNPFLYNAMSPRFRLAAYRLLFRGKRKKPQRSLSDLCRPLQRNYHGLFT